MEYIELKNEFETEVVLCSIGASICDIKTLDKKGKLSSIVLTPKERGDFPQAGSVFGKTIGRTGGRIQGGTFSLDGVDYTISSKDPNGLHGGDEGLVWKDFSHTVCESSEYFECDFYTISKDMESGYPGNLSLHVIYRLYKKENKLEVLYKGVCDKDTLCNLSNHAYFNLNVESGKKIFDHTLYINASKMERIEHLLPREIIPCEGIYSFKTPHKIGKYLMNEEIIQNTNGYDYPYILDSDSMKNENICLSDVETGRALRIRTTYPVVVMYTCNYIDHTIGNHDRYMEAYDAVCLECMYYPNNFKSDFLSEKLDVLKKGKEYNESIVYEFGFAKEEI